MSVKRKPSNLFVLVMICVIPILGLAYLFIPSVLVVLPTTDTLSLTSMGSYSSPTFISVRTTTEGGGCSTGLSFYPTTISLPNPITFLTSGHFETIAYTTYSCSPATSVASFCISVSFNAFFGPVYVFYPCGHYYSVTTFTSSRISFTTIPFTTIYPSTSTGYTNTALSPFALYDAAKITAITLVIVLAIGILSIKRRK
jgi:hypothetical protein